MQQEITRIVEKIDKLDEKLDAIDVHLAVYNEQLKIHIKRTELLEKDVAPIKEHVLQLKGVTKFISISSLLLGLLTAIKTYYGV